MKKNKNVEPSPVFYDFQVYKIEEDHSWKEKIDKEQSIIVVVKNASSTDLDLLNKIFQAVGKDMAAEVCVINISQSLTYKELTLLFDLKKVLVFGIFPKDFGLHINIDIYQTIVFQKVQFLFSDNLQIIANNLPKKKQLWTQLQTMFK